MPIIDPKAPKSGLPSKIKAKSYLTPLTHYETRFVSEFIVDLNKTNAALRANPYQSREKAHSSASYLCRKINVRHAIKRKLEEINHSLESRASRALQELIHISFSDARELFDPSGRLHDIHSIPDHIAPAISSIEVVKRRSATENSDIETYIHKIRLWDKPKALGMLGKHLGILRDVIEHTGPGGGPIQVQHTIDVASLPLWLKMAVIVAISGRNIGPEIEKIVLEKVEPLFLEIDPIEIEGRVEERVEEGEDDDTEEDEYDDEDEELEDYDNGNRTVVDSHRIGRRNGIRYQFIQGLGCGPFSEE